MSEEVFTRTDWNKALAILLCDHHRKVTICTGNMKCQKMDKAKMIQVAKVKKDGHT